MLHRENSLVAKSYFADGFMFINSFHVCILHITVFKSKSPEWVVRASVLAVNNSEKSLCRKLLFDFICHYMEIQKLKNYIVLHCLQESFQHSYLDPCHIIF